MDSILLYKGIKLSYINTDSNNLVHNHEPLENVMEINYCKEGKICIELNSGSKMYLGPGDYSINTMMSCANSKIKTKNEQYSGIRISIDLDEIDCDSIDIFKKSDICINEIYENYCSKGRFSSFAGNELTDKIFSYFFVEAEKLKLPYCKLKIIELLLYLLDMKPVPITQDSKYKLDQVEIVRQIHSKLVINIDNRYTIEELAKEYLINPTTLKTVFKSVYGNSIAAHIKEHRMEHAAKLLSDSDMSLAEIARGVGYENQSKFTAAFKAYYGVLPKEYRKR